MKLLVNAVAIGLLLLSETASCIEEENDRFEFGRATPRKSEERYQLRETEILLRELIDEQIISLSMSMSMSFVDPYVPLSPSVPPSTFNETDDERRIDLLTTAPPTHWWDSTENVTCDELQETVASIDLEVETIAGKESFAQKVASALSQALSREYSACNSPSQHKRRLETLSIFVGAVTVLVDPGSCVVLNEQGNRCYLAHAEISVSGIEDQQAITTAIANSVERVLNEDKSFDKGLKLHGITDVRLKGDETIAPQAAIQTNEAESPPESPATTAVVAIAATGAIVLAALALRRSRRTSDYRNLELGKDFSVGESNDNTSPLTASGMAI